MRLDKTDIIVIGIIFLFLLGSLVYFATEATKYKRKTESTFRVVEARREFDCTYTVGLKDKQGLYFSLTQDLIKFSAMGVDVDDILIYGEQ